MPAQEIFVNRDFVTLSAAKGRSVRQYLTGISLPTAAGSRVRLNLDKLNKKATLRRHFLNEKSLGKDLPPTVGSGAALQFWVNKNNSAK